MSSVCLSVRLPTDTDRTWKVDQDRAKSVVGENIEKITNFYTIFVVQIQ